MNWLIFALLELSLYHSHVFGSVKLLLSVFIYDSHPYVSLFLYLTESVAIQI